MKKTFLIALLMMISVMLFAGPFGMEFGWTLEELEASGADVVFPYSEDGRVAIYFIAPTKPHPDFDIYAAYIDTEYGLCMIRALSRTLYSENSIRNLYGKLKQQLTSVYGKSIEIDSLDPESMWKGSINFIRSIYYEDRGLGSSWFPEESEEAPSYVDLYVYAYDDTTAAVTIEYASQDIDAVTEASNAAAASVL